METLLQDVRSAVRRLAGQRGFTLTALVTLALGIGANTTMFGIVHGLLLRPLPYPDPEGIVHVGERYGGRGRGTRVTNWSMPVLQDAESFEYLAAYRESSLEWTGPDGVVTLPLHQLERAPMLGGFFSASAIAVRTAGDPLAVIPFLREAVTASSPGASIDEVMTMDARLSAAVAQPRFYAVFVGFFAALALFLAAFGIYALLSYTVSQRRREIGVRMALGAQRGDILALVVRQGAGLVAAGIVLGVLASAASARLLESFLFGVAVGDRLTFVAAPLVLAGVALVACWLPGRRAARLEPMDALRVE